MGDYNEPLSHDSVLRFASRTLRMLMLGCSHPSRGASVWAQLPGQRHELPGRVCTRFGAASLAGGEQSSQRMEGRQNGKSPVGQVCQSAACPSNAASLWLHLKNGDNLKALAETRCSSAVLPNTELIRAQTLKPGSWMRTQALPLTSWVTWNKLGKLTGPQVSHLWTVDKNYFTGFL